MAQSDRSPQPLDVHRSRSERWLRSPRVSTLTEAAQFVDDLGLALVFPADRIEAPSLWEAVAGEDVEPFANGMGDDESAVWEWKDELPLHGSTWYGKFLYRRGSFLSVDLLRALYPGEGQTDDHKDLDLIREAHDIAEVLRGGPMSTAALRQHIGDRSRYDRAVGELHRSLLITSAGVEPQRSGWPAALVDLTCRVFEVGGAMDHAYATRRFLDTIMSTTPRDLARAYGWSVPTARARLEDLVAQDVAHRVDGGVYVTSGNNSPHLRKGPAPKATRKAAKAPPSTKRAREAKAPAKGAAPATTPTKVVPAPKTTPRGAS